MLSDLFTFAAITTLALTITVTPACDADDHAQDADAEECPALAAPRFAFVFPEGVPSPTALTFREQGPPQNLVITEYGDATIKRTNFAKLIMSAVGQVDPPLTCTLSWYQPDTTKPDRVLGLGCSMMAPFKLFEFYRTVFEDNGGVPVP